MTNTPLEMFYKIVTHAHKPPPAPKLSGHSMTIRVAQSTYRVILDEFDDYPVAEPELTQSYDDISQKLIIKLHTQSFGDFQAEISYSKLAQGRPCQSTQ